MSESESVARALGAGDGVVEIAGKQCTIRPLGTRELAEVERECLKQYKRTYLQTFSENADLLPDEIDKAELISKRFEEAAKWDLDDLPQRSVSDWQRIKLTDKLKKVIAEVHTDANLDDDDKVKKLAASALDRNVIDAKRYHELTGADAPMVKVGYVNWWISGCVDGMITMIWMSFKDDGVTKDEVARALSEDQTLMVTISRRVEELSAPKSDFS